MGEPRVSGNLMVLLAIRAGCSTTASIKAFALRHRLWGRSIQQYTGGAYARKHGLWTEDYQMTAAGKSIFSKAGLATPASDGEAAAPVERRRPPELAPEVRALRAGTVISVRTAEGRGPWVDHALHRKFKRSVQVRIRGANGALRLRSLCTSEYGETWRVRRPSDGAILSLVATDEGVPPGADSDEDAAPLPAEAAAATEEEVGVVAEEVVAEEVVAEECPTYVGMDDALRVSVEDAIDRLEREDRPRRTKRALQQLDEDDAYPELADLPQQRIRNAVRFPDTNESRFVVRMKAAYSVYCHALHRQEERRQEWLHACHETQHMEAIVRQCVHDAASRL